MLDLKNYLSNTTNIFQEIKKLQKIEQITRAVLHKYFPFYIFMSREIMKTPFDNAIFKTVCDELREEIDA